MIDDPGALCPPSEHTPITTTRGTVLCEDCGLVLEEAAPSTEIERADLIDLCERGVVPEGSWRNRDSADAQRQLGEALALLRAGCAFRLADSPEGTDRTHWVLITFKGFAHFDYDGGLDEELFYIPTAERLEARDGDWY